MGSISGQGVMSLGLKARRALKLQDLRFAMLFWVKLLMTHGYYQ